MSAFAITVGAVWGLFGFCWVFVGTQNDPHRVRGRGQRFAAIVAVGLLAAFGRVPASAVHDPVLQMLGLAALLLGLGVAVWARVRSDRSWGVPMTQKAGAELVVSGPYRRICHPIYAGILLALSGTALATYYSWLLLLVFVGAYLIVAALVEERLLALTFPAVYAADRLKTTCGRPTDR